MDVIVVEVRRENHPDNKGGDLVFRSGRRWIRAGAYYGTPPGSHIGLWRTRWGPLRGLNLRIGRRYVGPVLTVFVHINLSRKG